MQSARERNFWRDLGKKADALEPQSCPHCTQNGVIRALPSDSKFCLYCGHELPKKSSLLEPECTCNECPVHGTPKFWPKAHTFEGKQSERS